MPNPTLYMADGEYTAVRALTDDDDDDKPSFSGFIRGLVQDRINNLAPEESVLVTEHRLRDVDRVRAADGVRGTIVARVPSFGGEVIEWEYDLDIESTTLFHIEWDDGVSDVRSALEAEDLEVIR